MIKKSMKDICTSMYQGINTVADKVEYLTQGKPIIQSKNITSGYLDLEDVRYVEECVYQGYREKYNPNKGDILFCNIGTIGTSYVVEKQEEFLIAWNLFLLRIDQEQARPNYVRYYLQYLKDRDYYSRLLTGGTVKFINKTKFGEIEVPLAEIREQMKIESVLVKAEELINKRKEQIKACDELIKSQFIEMFGDPVTNPNGWEIQQCKDIASKIGSGATPKGGNASYKETGISLIRSMNVHNNNFVYKDLAYIDDEQANKLSNVVVEESDILLNITGASVARSCIVPKDVLPARVNQHVSIVRCKQGIIQPVFLCHLFTNESYQKLLWSIATSGGATREAITKQQEEELDLIIPPIELQNRFAQFVQQVDKLKFEMEQSLVELENNFNSLMQRAFKGELF